MTTLTETTGIFAEQFTRLHAGGPAWLAPTRKAAMERFTQLGFPTTRDEEWRFTNVAPIARTRFEIADTGAKLESGALQPYLFDAHLLVFVNGRFRPELSAPGKLPEGVHIGSLGEAIASGTELVRAHMAKYAGFEDAAFTALNTASSTDGAFISVGRGQLLTRPIHVLYVSIPGKEPGVAHPRTLVLLGEASQATLVESYVGIGDGVYFTNAVTEIVAGENAVLDHCRVQRESHGAYHIGRQQFHQSRSSNITSISVHTGAAIARLDVGTVLDGEGCECTLNGLYMAGGTQHVDNHLRVEHAKPHCQSWEYYKGILDNEAHGVFTGRIVVHKDAQKTDAKQTNMNLLLSEGAQIDTKPQLEIFADDVKCTHGATIGQIDPDAIFYLQARGISLETARSMLIYAFANESLDSVRVEPVRDQLREVLFARLPGGKRLKGSV